MRRYTKQEFLTLPEGVIYYKDAPWERLSVKGESLGERDFISLDLCNIENTGENDLADTLERMIPDRISRPINDSAGRDGLYNDGDEFMVFEDADLDALAEHIARAKGLKLP